MLRMPKKDFSTDMGSVKILEKLNLTAKYEVKVFLLELLQ
jgi:hypothetical protein